MRNKYFILLMLTALYLPLNICSQEQTADQSFDYPVKPGTEQWKALKSRAARIKACQIPENKLKNIPTEQLLEICYNYPFIIDVAAYNNFEDGFNKMIAEFNGLRELLGRKDLSSVALNNYKALDPARITEKETLLEKGEYNFRQIRCEMILHHIISKKGFSSSENIDVITEFINKYNSKRKLPYDYTDNSYEVLSNATNRLLGNIKNTNFKAVGNNTAARDTINIIVNMHAVFYEAKTYLNQYHNKAGNGNKFIATPQEDPEDILAEIHTPACTLLENTYYYHEMSEADLEYYETKYDESYPEAVKLGPATRLYNCHGYAWYVSEGGENVWIAGNPSPDNPPPCVRTFYEDGSYYEVSNEAVGEKVVYIGGAAHSAITTETPGWFISKWGRGPLFFHEADECPFPVFILKYYRADGHLSAIGSPTTYTRWGDIFAEGPIQPNLPSDVQLISGRRIFLKPGFQVSGTDFSGSIMESCWPEFVEPASPYLNFAMPIDINSSFNESNKSEVPEETDILDEEILIYPNPVKDKIYVDGTEMFDIRITDSYGRIVMNAANMYESVDISDLSQGIYFIRINVNGKEYTRRIVK